MSFPNGKMLVPSSHLIYSDSTKNSYRNRANKHFRGLYLQASTSFTVSLNSAMSGMYWQKSRRLSNSLTDASRSTPISLYPQKHPVYSQQPRQQIHWKFRYLRAVLRRDVTVTVKKVCWGWDSSINELNYWLCSLIFMLSSKTYLPNVSSFSAADHAHLNVICYHKYLQDTSTTQL